MIETVTNLVRSQKQSYCMQRIADEFAYAAQLSDMLDHRYDELINEAERAFEEKVRETDGVVTPQIMRETEEMLMPLAAEAKSYTILCAGHAHIDMNWQWGFQETVDLTVDTVGTVLSILDRYPEFCFSQSQASVYKILEDYRPDLLERVKAYVHAGRWEVTAATWVEHDKNMPSGESQARQLLYAKRYVSQLLDIPSDAICIDFEPDTFGHNAMEPELLCQAGIRYYYHCRGSQEVPQLYRWRSASGRELLVNREKDFYFAKIDGKMATQALEVSKASGIRTSIRVYGVGDHGGGPTIRDIERIRDMGTWPIFPRIRFGTYREFFETVEKQKELLPVHEGDINFVFDGCYSAQSRVKAGNKKLERDLYTAEMWAALGGCAPEKISGRERFREAWIPVLFNQFHDIVTGSGVRDTREHAMGSYMDAQAIADNSRKYSLEKIAAKINTSNLVSAQELADESLYHAIAYGAGVGSGQVERGQGLTRVLHVFNPLPFDRRENVEALLWEWYGDFDRLEVTDTKGNPVRFQILENGYNYYWWHYYTRILIETQVPASGYATYLIREGKRNVSGSFYPEKRQQFPEDFTLENEYLKVTVDPLTGEISSVTDKETGHEYADKDRRNGVFCLIEEANRKQISGWESEMSSWLKGRHASVSYLNDSAAEMTRDDGPLRQTVTWETDFGQQAKNGDPSHIRAQISLDAGSRFLKYRVICDWREKGSQKRGTPQLAYRIALNRGETPRAYLQDVPFGVQERTGRAHDLPALNFSASAGQDEWVCLVSEDQYGYRLDDDSMALTLLRGSFDPDPYPENGRCERVFAVGYYPAQPEQAAMLDLAHAQNQPMNVVSNGFHLGSMPDTGSLFVLKGEGISVSAIKQAQDADGIIVRLYTLGVAAKAQMVFARDVQSARITDILEEETRDSERILAVGRSVSVDMDANSILTVRIILKEKESE